MPSEGLSVAISGRVIRSRRMVVNGNRTVVLSIQFAEITPRLRGLFFCMAGSMNGHHPAADHRSSSHKETAPACGNPPSL
jgi:hypothetical protein